MTKQTKILAGLLAGAAVGAGIALILSSDKDGALKEKISDWACDLIDNSKKLLENSKEKLNAVTNKITEKISEAKNG